LKCGPVKEVTFTGPGNQFLPVTKTEGTGIVAPDPIFGCQKAGGPERVYAVTYNGAAGTKAFLTASLRRLNTNFDTVLYAKKSCCAGPTELCADSTDAAGTAFGGEVLSMPVTAGDTWYIFVDGADPDDSGNYEIAFNLSYGWSCAGDQFYIPIQIERGSPITLKGTTDIEDETNGCGSAGFGWIGWGSSAVYELRWAPDVTGVDIKLNNKDVMVQNDTLFYVRTACETQSTAGSTPASELACIDINNSSGELLQLPLTGKPQPLFLFSDVGKGEGGPFELTLTPK
jgi:hypothetical protein